MMMKEFLHNVDIYFSFARIAFLTQLEYRASYAIRMLSKIVNWSSRFILILVMLNRFGSIGSWNTYEVLFLYAMDVLTYSIASTFCMPLIVLPSRISQGVFDGILTKPVNSLFYYLCNDISAGYTSNYIIGVGILLISAFQLRLKMSIVNILLFLIVLAGATLIQASAFFFTMVPSFWMIKNNVLYNLFYRNLTSFCQYPINIYDKGIQFLLTFVTPYAFINFYPAQFFLGKQDSLFHPVFQYLTPAIGIVLIVLAYRFWLIGIKHYNSSGS